MEALELFREERRKLEDHEYACRAAGRQVEAPPTSPTLSSDWLPGNLDPGLTPRDLSNPVFFFFFKLILLPQLPAPKPNPILVAYGNVTVRAKQP